jgi:hypothetical protein
VIKGELPHGLAKVHTIGMLYFKGFTTAAMVVVGLRPSNSVRSFIHVCVVQQQCYTLLRYPNSPKFNGLLQWLWCQAATKHSRQ